jgi:hypothetical protein
VIGNFGAPVASPGKWSITGKKQPPAHLCRNTAQDVLFWQRSKGKQSQLSTACDTILCYNSYAAGHYPGAGMATDQAA